MPDSFVKGLMNRAGDARMIDEWFLKLLATRRLIKPRGTFKLSHRSLSAGGFRTEGPVGQLEGKGRISR